MIWSFFIPLGLSLPMFFLAAWVFLRMRNPQRVNLIRIAILTFVLHFGLMPLISFAIQSVTTGVRSSTPDLFKAYNILYFYLIGILLVLLPFSSLKKTYRKEREYTRLIFDCYNQLPKSRVFFAWLIVMGILNWIKFYYGFTYYGSSTLERFLSVPYPLVILRFILEILVFGFMAYGLISIIRFKNYDLISFLFISSQIILKFDSRTNFIALFLLFLLVILMFNKFRVPYRKLGFLSGIGLVMVLFFFPLLQTFRHYTNQIAQENEGNTNYQAALEIALETSDDESQQEKNLTNIEYRTNFIDRNISLQNYPLEEGYMNGLNITYQLLSVIPRALFPQKIQMTKQLNSESAIFFYYQKPHFDFADNLPLYGYLDFGYPGSILSGMLLAFILIFFEWLAYFTFPISRLGSLSILIFVIYHHLDHEFSYTAEFANIRNAVILVILLLCVFIIKRAFGHH